MKQRQLSLKDEILEHLHESELAMLAVKDLIMYLNIKPHILIQIQTIDLLLKDAFGRTMKDAQIKNMRAHLLSIQQIRMVTNDILQTCKGYMISA